MTTPASPRWLRILAPAGALVVSAGLAVFLPPAPRAPTLGDLERQLALATDAREAGAVRELARRIALLDATPERQLRFAETFLALGMNVDLERALDAAVRASPIRPRVVDRFRAQAAATRGDWAVAIGHWNAFLDSPVGLPPEQRSAALDELVTALMQQHAWQLARTRLDERLALADGAAPRLVRATVLVRTRRWAEAGEDFLHLQRVASDDTRVKPLLPRWERVARALPELTACDAALDAAPAALAPRLDRAFVALRSGLSQNAAEDFAVAAREWPMTRMPRLMLATLACRGDPEPPGREPEWAVIESLPLLAPSEDVLARNEQIGERHAWWQALRACDIAIAAETERAALPVLRAEQARLVCTLGHPRQALEDARDLLRETPHYLPADRVEIMALLAMQSWIEADSKVTAALQHHTDPNGSVDAELGRLAGFIWQAQGKHQAAVDVFTAHLGAHRTAEVLRARAKSLRFLQRFGDASDDLAAAEALEAATAVKTP